MVSVQKWRSGLHSRISVIDGLGESQAVVFIVGSGSHPGDRAAAKQSGGTPSVGTGPLLIEAVGVDLKRTSPWMLL